MYMLPVVFSRIRVLEVIQKDCKNNNNERKYAKSFSERVAQQFDGRHAKHSLPACVCWDSRDSGSAHARPVRLERKARECFTAMQKYAFYYSSEDMYVSTKCLDKRVFVRARACGLCIQKYRNAYYEKHILNKIICKIGTQGHVCVSTACV